MKRQQIENNIRSIQDRIKMLESSFHQSQADEIEELEMESPSKNERIVEPESRHGSGSKLYAPSVNKQLINPYKSRVMDSPVQSENIMMEDLMKELDELRQLDEKYNIKIETLEFRCDKLQDELTSKQGQINDLTSEFEEQKSKNKKLRSQMQSLENQMESNQRSQVPQIQKLKNHSEVIQLEMKSIENDNRLLDDRVIELEKKKQEIAEFNQNLKNENLKMEMERLSLKMEVEQVRAKFNEYEDEIFYTEKKIDETEFENERLRNEINYLSQKIDILSSSFKSKAVVELEDRSLNYTRNPKNNQKNEGISLGVPGRRSDRMTNDRKTANRQTSSKEEGYSNKSISKNYNSTLPLNALEGLQEKLTKLNQRA